MPNFAIQVSSLTKRFGALVAVDNVSFCVEQGSITALLGGNGAGKTTIISILMGLLVPTSGNVRIFNGDVVKERYQVLPKINFSSPYVDLPNRLTVKENLQVYAELYSIRDTGDHIANLAKRLAIEDILSRKTGQLSAGQKTRVALAKALINQPKLLFLDEPTASLDPDTADWVRAYISEYANETGATILLASHNMAEVERLCDKVLMLRTGIMVDIGSPTFLIHKYGRSNMEEVFLDVARNRRVVL
ncbi:MAG: ABC transporter [Rhodospirillaceae bacterium]|nr:ABC transporter [Rhodospirillaceae bacterium]|tara:strand:+ start:333 stop:1073 length:741 start_codon:yes stop_codon:yes gene_type:complete